ENKENTQIEKKPKLESIHNIQTLVELQGRRLLLHQAPWQRNIPKRRMWQLNFESFLLDVEEAGKKVTEIPEEHWPLVAMLGHESSAATEVVLARQIRSGLATKEQQDLIDMDAVLGLIPRLFQQKHYGFTREDFPVTPRKLPVSLQIIRWEVREISVYLPTDQVEVVRSRIAIYEKARQQCLRILESMDDIEKLELLRSEKAEKVTGKDKAPGMEDVSSLPGTTEKARRIKHEEREAKRLALAEKKALPQHVSPPAESDFHKTFKPVAVRPNIVWAPINRWLVSRRSRTNNDDSEPADDDGYVANWGPAVHLLNHSDFIADHLKKHRIRPFKPRSLLPPGLKSGPLYGSVADIWAAHQEAADPRKVLNQLCSRHKFPWKTLAFDQQVRPPYSGTWTKKSLVVGPRTPFAQDPIFDYSYDSGDEWEDDEGGEDVDDFAEEAEVDGSEGDDEDDEFDDWLDDSEDFGIQPMPADDEVFVASPKKLDQKLLPMKVVKKSREVPKKVAKITPYWRGPEWERQIGKGTDGLEPFRLELLNETPSTIDPFTFTSPSPAPTYKTSFSTIAIGPNLNVRCLYSAEHITTPVPALPVKQLSNTTTIMMNGAGPSKRFTGPKVAFPAEQLGELYRLVHDNPRIRTDLVSQLKAHFGDTTTKAAIEHKVKEVAVREGKTKDSKWRVRSEAWVSSTSSMNIYLIYLVGRYELMSSSPLGYNHPLSSLRREYECHEYFYDTGS
ncbi:hypothetical protein TREMEDRAFT_34970, partial [Tremella mesenterica DSM 1558]|uniref:uncharacterized protein n=1 Tax=Tremella mesenterica (strain ATCC 24925 / CBS 8224 / DSM 1558 / NBRC 9311 / NRRL Y-6157 / RJB 2259-6 / UBC 559-6) TaxID=578456 RepID=UPI00032BE650